MQRTYFQLRCPECDWTEICGPEQMVHWLRRVQKVRAGREPEPEFLVEVFRSAAAGFCCPRCEQTGLAAMPVTDDNCDWPETRPCSACGKIIPPERLQAIPGATLCARCQQDEEHGAGPTEVEYCPKCGAPMALRLSRSSGVTRYVMNCTAHPPCRL